MPDLRTTGRKLAIVASALWIVVTIYQEFIDVDPSEVGFKSPELEQKMRSCSGTFGQRYHCKNDLIIEKGQEDFMFWLVKVAWVFAPPAALFGLLRVGQSPPGRKGGPGSAPPRDVSRWRVK